MTPFLIHATNETKPPEESKTAAMWLKKAQDIKDEENGLDGESLVNLFDNESTSLGATVPTDNTVLLG